MKTRTPLSELGFCVCVCVFLFLGWGTILPSLKLALKDSTTTLNDVLGSQCAISQDKHS